MSSPSQRRSPWLYVGIGCGAVAVIALVTVGAAVFLTARAVKGLQDEMQDPAARTEAAKRLLGARELPPGYHAAFGMSLPMLFDMAMLTDREPDEAGQVRDFTRGFIYFKFIVSQNQQELRDYFEGKTDDPSVLKRSGVNVEVRELLRRGALGGPGRASLYLCHRGVTNTGNLGTRRGLNTVVFFQCPQDQKTRMGVWFGEDPSPDVPIAEADFTGTVADEREIEAFLGHFDPCSR